MRDLQLAVVGREGQLTEALRLWVRCAQETCANEDLPIIQRLNTVVRDVCELLRLELVDGAASLRDIALVPRIGSVARMLLRNMRLGRLWRTADRDEETNANGAGVGPL